jgi:hypothetical protein
MNVKRTSALSPFFTNDTIILATISEDITKDIQDGISHKHSSTMSVNANISSTLHPLSPFLRFNTTLLPSHRSRFSSPLHHSPTRSSTKAPKFSQFSSSKRFSGRTKTKTPLLADTDSMDSDLTTVPSDSTVLSSFTSTPQSSHQFLSIQTTDAAKTSDIFKQKPITTLSRMPSSLPFTTHHSRSTPTISSTSSLTTDEQPLKTKFEYYTSKPAGTNIESSSLSYEKSTEIFPTNYQSILITLAPSTNLDVSSTRSIITFTDEKNLAISDHQPLETTETLQLSSTRTDKYQEGSISTQTPFKSTSMMFPQFYKAKTSSTLAHSTFDISHPSTQSNLPIRRRTSYLSTTSTITTTISRYRTRKQKMTRWQTQPLSTTTTTSSLTTTIIPSYQTTLIYSMSYISS